MKKEIPNILSDSNPKTVILNPVLGILTVIVSFFIYSLLDIS